MAAEEKVSSEHPKLFISYSWSSEEHKQWVFNLATDLSADGVDVILDRWDLKDGDDAHAFMERMVTDPEIAKVAIVCDRKYSEKANDRSGGVGTETQIITGEIFEKQQQDKFVAIVLEKDDSGQHIRPAYYKSRVFIDFSDPDKSSESYDRLLRWIYNQPLDKKPDIGRKPAHLDAHSVSLGTSASFRRAQKALESGSTAASGCLEEYFETFSQNLERFRIERSDAEFDEQVVNSIDEFVPYREEVIRMIITLARYAPNKENMRKVHRFMEQILPYKYPPSGITQWNSTDSDNFRFIVHELFLYTIVVLLRAERFEQAAFLLDEPYYLQSNPELGPDDTVSFFLFRSYVESLSYRNERLKLKRLSLHADILKARCTDPAIQFRNLMQADFILFIRSELLGTYSFDWWPETLLYSLRVCPAFEIFARAKSARYFESIKCLFGVNSVDDLKELVQQYTQRKRKLPTWERGTFAPELLMGIDKLASDR